MTTNTPSPTDEDRELIGRVAKAVRDNLGWQHGHIPSQIRSENIARIAVRECLSDRAKLEEALLDIRNRVLCPVGPSPTIDHLQEIASKALNRSTDRAT